jgi:hypothetical protein
MFDEVGIHRELLQPVESCGNEWIRIRNRHKMGYSASQRPCFHGNSKGSKAATT